MTDARVLYVDDDMGLGVLLHRALQPHGFTVETVASGEEAVALLLERPFDVVALDHNLTNEIGLNLIPRIRALPEAPPIIYVTGSEDARIAVAALKAGAVDYVWKDVQGHYRELLREAIKNAIQQEQLKRQAEVDQRQIADARDRAEALLKEVNHRVANSLALVSSFVQLQSNALSDPAAKEILRDTHARILAVAGVHRRLYTSSDVRSVEANAYFQSLVEELAASSAYRSKVIFLPAPESVDLPTDKAVSLGVVVTELVTNACKYAYVGDTEGEVRVILSTAAASRLAVRVEDDGVGWTGQGAIQGSGLGARIIKAMAHNLQAQLIYLPTSVGTRAELTLPL